MLLAAVSLGGWALGLPALIRVLPWPAAGTMMPNTAVGILALGVALLLLARADARGTRVAAGRLLAGAASLLGLLTLAQYATGFPGGLDRLLFPEAVRALTTHLPGRPAPATAFSLALGGAALALLDADRRGRPTALLAAPVIAIAAWALVGYLLGEPEIVAGEHAVARLPRFTPMAFHTALAFLVLALGTLAARADRPPISLLVGRDAGAFMARRALPAVVAVPIVFAWARLVGERAGLYSTAIGISLLAVFTVAALVGIILWNAVALRRLDAARRVASEALRDARVRLDLGLSAGSVATWMYDVAGNRVRGDERLAAMFAIPAARTSAGAPLEAFVAVMHPEDRQRVVDAIGRAIEVRSAYEEEYRVVRPDGAVRWVIARGGCEEDAATGEVRFPGAIVDVTERRRLAEHQRLLAKAGLELSASLDPDRAAAAVANVAVPGIADWCVVDLLDEDGHPRAVGVAAASPTAETALRMRLERVPDAAPCIGSVIARRLGAAGSLLLSETSSDVAHRPLLAGLDIVSALILPLVARDRRLGTVLLAVRERTRRYDALDLAFGEELARRAALAIDNASLYHASRRATEMRDEVLRVVAHDLRNPLAAIAMDAKLIARGLGGERLADHRRVERIRFAVDRADRLIRDLLDVARLDAGRLSLALHPEPLAPLLSEAVDLHRTIGEELGVTVEFLTPGDLGLVVADRDRVLQILGNLIANAIKFTPAGGRVVVRAESADPDVRVTVTDTGPGIAAEHLTDLFRPFWQVRPGSGVGLGLAIAKAMVEAHGGRIGADSVIGAGSTFWFTLPLATAAALGSSEAGGREASG